MVEPIKAGIVYEAIDRVSAVVKTIENNEKRAAAAAAKAVLDAENAKQKAIKDSIAAANAASKAYSTSYTEIVATAQVAKKAIEFVSAVTIDAAKAAAENEREEKKLFLAMQARTSITKAEFEALKQSNIALEQKLGLDADDLIQIQGKLSLQGVANGKLAEATKQTIGLAQVTGSLESAERLVAKAMEGNITGLKRYLPQVTDVVSAQDELNKLFSIAESNADNLATRLDGLAVSWENTKEAIGATRIAQEAVGGATQILTDANRVFQSRLQNGEGIITSSAKVLFDLTNAMLGTDKSAMGLTSDLEDQVNALNAVQTGADAAAKAITALNKATGFFDFQADPGNVEGDRGRKEQEKAEKKREADSRRAAEKAAAENKRRIEASQKEQRELAEKMVSTEEFFGSLLINADIEIGRQRAEAFKTANDEILKGQKDAAKELEQLQEARANKRGRLDFLTSNPNVGSGEDEDPQIRAIDAAIEAQEALRQKTMEVNDTLLQTGLTGAEAFASIGIAAAQGKITGETAMKQLAAVTLQAVGQIIQATVAQAMAKRVAATTEVLATGAATAAKAGQDAGSAAGAFAVAVVPGVIGAMMAIFAALLTSFAKGGMVTGGSPGRDSVPALLMPGERVLTVNQNHAFESALGGRTNTGPMFAEGGVVGKNRPSQQVTLVMQQLVPERDTNFRSTMRQTVAPELGRLVRDGAGIDDPRSFGPRG